jgi:20S proteasome subunit beta 1
MFLIGRTVRNQTESAPKVSTTARLFKQMCYANKDRLMAGIIVAGWDEADGPSVYNIPLGGSLHKQPFAIGGSGSTYIFGYCDSNFRESMTKEEAVAFVTNAIALAISRDGSSGGVIRLAVIDANGVERKVVCGEEIPKFYEA